MYGALDQAAVQLATTEFAGTTLLRSCREVKGTMGSMDCVGISSGTAIVERCAQKLKELVGSIPGGVTDVDADGRVRGELGAQAAAEREEAGGGRAGRQRFGRALWELVSAAAAPHCCDSAHQPQTNLASA